MLKVHISFQAQAGWWDLKAGEVSRGIASFLVSGQAISEVQHINYVHKYCILKPSIRMTCNISPHELRMRECCLRTLRVLPGLTVPAQASPGALRPCLWPRTPCHPRGWPALPWQHHSRAGLQVPGVGPTRGLAASGLPHPPGSC